MATRGQGTRNTRRMMGEGGASFAENKDAVAQSFLIAPTITITRDDVDKPHHLLTDDQLEDFSELSKDTSREWMLFFLAGALGLSQNALTLIGDQYTKAVSSHTTVVLSLLFVACLVGAAMMWRTYRANHPKLLRKIEAIRNRPKTTIQRDEGQ